MKNYFTEGKIFAGHLSETYIILQHNPKASVKWPDPKYLTQISAQESPLCLDYSKKPPYLQEKNGQNMPKKENGVQKTPGAEKKFVSPLFITILRMSLNLLLLWLHSLSV